MAIAFICCCWHLFSVLVTQCNANAARPNAAENMVCVFIIFAIHSVTVQMAHGKCCHSHLMGFTGVNSVSLCSIRLCFRCGQSEIRSEFTYLVLERRIFSAGILPFYLQRKHISVKCRRCRSNEIASWTMFVHA